MKVLMIGLAGRAGAGKDTVGGFIKKHLEPKGEATKLMAFAEPLKSICKAVYAFTDEQMTQHELKVKGDLRYPRADGSYLSPREAMQLLGTEWARRCYANTWVDLGIRRAREANVAHIVFTDCRFINEANGIRNAGGQVWRIYRAEADKAVSNHASETEMNTEEFKELVTHVVYNSGDLEQLRKIVQGHLS